jgi:DNA-binding CsgD family transcriptional regulator
MITTYAIMAMIATVLLIGYCALVRKKEPWLLLLYVCVTIVNVGYFLLSISKTIEFAIFANDVAYFGSIFLSMSMLLTIIKLCGFEVKKKLVIVLIALGAAMFVIVATSGILPWYYKEISLVFVDGAAKLEKVYGVLHPTYLVYLLAYFATMVVCIIQSIRKKMIASQRYAALLAAIVFGNIAVWLVEKFIPWNFEFLSVSYLFSELILLGLYWMMQDYVRSDLISQPVVGAPRPAPIDITTMPMEEKILKVLSSLKPGEMLAEREREVLELVLQNKKRKEIADELCLSENTIKTYTRTLYGKVGVSSREELYALLMK